MFIMWQGSVTNSVALPNPEIGDGRSLDTSLVVKRARGGEVKAVKDSDWQDIETNTYTFGLLTEDEKNALISFVTTHAGLEIHIIDHHSTEWVGVILDDVFDVVTNRDECSYATSFEFMGERV